MKSFYDELEEGMASGWSYPWAYGYLCHWVRSYLRADCTRDRLTAHFAQLELVHSKYADSFTMIPDPAEALRAALTACRESAPCSPSGADEVTEVSST